MKKTILLSAATLLFFVLTATQTNAETTRITLYEEPKTIDGKWDDYITLSKDQLSDAEAGDTVVVEVTVVSETMGSPQLDFRNGSWAEFDGMSAIQVKDLKLPAEVTLTLTDDIIAAINGEVENVSSGMIITGEGITFDKVSLVKTVALTSGAGKGNAVTSLWTGEQEIDWNNNEYEVLAASIFNDEELNIVAGMKLRVTFTNLKMNGLGRIVHNWTSFDGLSNMMLTTACGTYYEYTLTDDIISYLKSDGLRLSGVGYTATSIDLIDPDKEFGILASYDQSDIKAWAADEEPNITLTITNLQTEELEIPVDVHLMKDTWVDYKDYSETITIGGGETQTVDVALTGLDPGFYRMAVNANNNFVCTYVIGYNPTAIGCETDAQDDFWTFWDGWKEALSEIELKAELTKLDDYCTDNRNVYEVKVQSAPDSVGGDPVNIWLYYAEPVADGKYPTIIHFQGTDSGTSTPTPIGGDDNPGWCEITVSTRGQMLSRVKLQDTDDYIDYYVEDEDDSNNYGFYAYEYGDKDKHYYRAAYLDCLRGVDFALSRGKVDADNIFAVGGSQGGCFTYVAAALSGKMKAIAPSITGHSDFAHSREIVTWPTNVFVSNQTKLSWTDDQINTFNSYFDTKNFVSRITCPVISNFSLQDYTDAPHLNIAPYNLLTNVADEDKEYSINQFLGHATPSDWTTTYMNFFAKYLSVKIDGEGGCASYYVDYPLDFTGIEGVMLQRK